MWRHSDNAYGLEGHHLRCAAAMLLCALSVGCHSLWRVRAEPPTVTPPPPPPTNEAPRELAKVSLPSYVIEPPDILLIDAVKIVPKPPHKVETFDVLSIRVEGALLDQPINGLYNVEADGQVDLGLSYGRVAVVDLTMDEARATIDRHLRAILQNPQVSVALAASAGAQRIAGVHLVGPDGLVNLGTYGNVYVTGMTLAQAKSAIEKQLENYLDSPVVTVDVFAYNSKVFYVVTESRTTGDDVIRMPITGNETVLDAVSAIGGLSQLSSKRIWISRPAPNGVGCEQVLPVNWTDITRGGSTATNYQILPGDRLFIAEDRLVAIDGAIARLTRPVERLLGVTLLGSQTISRLNVLPGAAGTTTR